VNENIEKDGGVKTSCEVNGIRADVLARAIECLEKL
jgi:hypothetical protein